MPCIFCLYSSTRAGSPRGRWMGGTPSGLGLPSHDCPLYYIHERFHGGRLCGLYVGVQVVVTVESRAGPFYSSSGVVAFRTGVRRESGLTGCPSSGGHRALCHFLPTSRLCRLVSGRSSGPLLPRLGLSSCLLTGGELILHLLQCGRPPCRLAASVTHWCSVFPLWGPRWFLLGSPESRGQSSGRARSSSVSL